MFINLPYYPLFASRRRQTCDKNSRWQSRYPCTPLHTRNDRRASGRRRCAPSSCSRRHARKYYIASTRGGGLRERSRWRRPPPPPDRGWCRPSGAATPPTARECDAAPRPGPSPGSATAPVRCPAAHGRWRGSDTRGSRALRRGAHFSQLIL